MDTARKTRTPFVVHIHETRVAKFSDPDNAHEFAQFYSERHDVFVDVSAPHGLIGQYNHGKPTAEFAGREDAWFPAGRHSAKEWYVLTDGHDFRHREQCTAKEVSEANASIPEGNPYRWCLETQPTRPANN